MFVFSTMMAQYLSQWMALRALCFSVWATLAPGYMTPEQQEIAEAIATAVLEEDAPVYESLETDAATMAVFAYGESRLRRNPRPESWDARAGQSCAVWQQRCSTLAPTIVGQARVELELLRRGAVLCPESPAATLGGSCHGAARRLADGRVAQARALVAHQ